MLQIFHLTTQHPVVWQLPQLGDLRKFILTALVETTTQILLHLSFHIQQNPVFSMVVKIMMSKKWQTLLKSQSIYISTEELMAVSWHWI
jgi:hypothetical protein